MYGLPLPRTTVRAETARLRCGHGAHLLHGALRGLTRRERHEGVAAVGARHGVHHEAQVPDGAAALEQRDELVLVHVLRDLPAEHLAAGARRAALPPGRRPTVLALTCTRNPTSQYIQVHYNRKSLTTGSFV